jgi:hypothetical protein
MIVSHRHQLIFLKPRKVAGTSFEIALSKYLSEDDIITPLVPPDEGFRTELGFQGARNFNFPLIDLLGINKKGRAKLLCFEVPVRYRSHIPAKLVEKRLPRSVWNGYRKVSIVRNPWDRAVSYFFWKHKNGQPNFTHYYKEKPHVLKTNHRIYMIDGQDVVDHYIRYEHFEEDIRALERRISGIAGLWDTFKNIKAKSEWRKRSVTTAEIFAANPEVNALVEQANAWEIAKFDYRLPDIGSGAQSASAGERMLENPVQPT